MCVSEKARERESERKDRIRVRVPKAGETQHAATLSESEREKIVRCKLSRDVSLYICA